MTEWAHVVGYEGLYDVSTEGEVRSFDRKTLSRFGNFKLTPGKLMKQETSNAGYKRVALSKEGNNKKFAVHRLVAEAFIPNPDDKPCINHLDGNRANNNRSNLEWCTYKENTDYGVTKGSIKFPNYTRIKRICSKEDCLRYVNGRGLCAMHYKRFMRQRKRAGL